MAKTFPRDYTHEELAALVLFHQQQHAEALTKYSAVLEKLKVVGKELSALKRNK